MKDILRMADNLRISLGIDRGELGDCDKGDLEMIAAFGRECAAQAYEDAATHCEKSCAYHFGLDFRDKAAALRAAQERKP